MAKYTPQTRDDLKRLVDNFGINLGDIDVVNITDMSYLFKESTRKNFDGIEKWNVSNVKQMKCMFANCHLFNQDISGWDVRKVEKICQAFAFTSNFNQDLSKWQLDALKNAHNQAPFLGNDCIKQDFKPHPFNKAGF